MKKIPVDVILALIWFVFAIAIIAISICITKWIANSDLPFWMKFWLLK